MLERDVERLLGNEIRKRGGLYLKFVSPGNPGVPDRLCVMPAGRVWFVELKTDRGRLSEQQKVQIGKIRKRGAAVEVVYGVSGVKEFTDALDALDRGHI